MMSSLLGETEPTTIYSENANLFKGQYQSDGFYYITLGADNKVATADLYMGAYGAGHTAAGVYQVAGKDAEVEDLYWARAYVKDYQGGSLVLTKEDLTSVFADYIASGAKFFDVTMTVWADADGNNTARTSIAANADQSVSAGDRVVVGYDKDGVAVYVYVLKTVTNDTTAPAAPAVPNSLTIKDDGSVYMTLDNAAKKGDKYSFELYILTSNSYQKVGDFEATVQGDTKAAWVDLSDLLVHGNTYKAVYGDNALVAYKGF